ILRNLVDNSIKYRNPNRDKPEVVITTRDEPGSVVFQVIDNGLGIPEKHGAEVFQTFRRFHAESVEGNGLGLAIVKKQVGFLDGEISFSSSEQGTKFEVLLPTRPGA